MTDTQAAFSQLEGTIRESGVAAGLEQLVSQLRGQDRFHELFEALKMQVRHSLGLPVLYDDSGDELPEGTRQQLEDGLLAACQEVGMRLLQAGQVREGWMYLRPVGAKADVTQALRGIAPDDENLDALIEVALHEGVDPALGFGLVLEHHGTCNAITTYESIVGRLGKPQQQAVAGQLVDHVHGELLASVVADIARQEETPPADANTLAELIEDRPWLFGEYSYHIDTTHLASTVRFSRVLEDKARIALALDLCAYGGRLNQQFQYPGEEPFTDFYPSHTLYLSALGGQRLDEAIAYFRARADEADPHQHGSQAVEAFVELLDRLQRYDEAIEVVLDFAQRTNTEAAQVLPLLLGLAEKSGDFSKVVDFCREGQDLLGFGTGLIQAELATGK